MKLRITELFLNCISVVKLGVIFCSHFASPPFSEEILLTPKQPTKAVSRSRTECYHQNESSEEVLFGHDCHKVETPGASRTEFY